MDSSNENKFEPKGRSMLQGTKVKRGYTGIEAFFQTENHPYTKAVCEPLLFSNDSTKAISLKN
jgi:hypothetical protein